MLQHVAFLVRGQTLTSARSPLSDRKKIRDKQEFDLKRPVILLVVLFVIWLLWSGHFDLDKDLLLIGSGIASCLLVVVLCVHMDIVDKEGMPYQVAPRFCIYFPWLVWRIVLANIDVARRVLHPELPISPTLVEVQASQKTHLGNVIFANSITLTPGTISIRVRKGVILVHAVTREAASALQEGEMDRRVTVVEGAS